MFLDEWFTLVKANQSRIMQSLELRIRVHIHRIRPSRTKARSVVLTDPHSDDFYYWDLNPPTLFFFWGGRCMPPLVAFCLLLENL